MKQCVSEDPTREKMYCVQCGNKIKDGAKFCAVCGTQHSVNEMLTEQAAKVQSPVVTSAQNMPVATKSVQGTGKLIIILILSVLLVAAVAGGFILTKQGKSIQDRGYATPEQAVEAYFQALNEGDLEKMVGTFAIEDYVTHFDIEKCLNRMASHGPQMPGIFGMENSNSFAQQLNLETRKAVIEKDIRNQYIYLIAPQLLNEGMTQNLQTEEEVKDFLKNYPDEERLKDYTSLKIIRTVEPEELIANWNDEIAQKNRKRYNAMYGMDEMTSIIVEIEFEGERGIMCFDVAKCENKWRNVSLGGYVSFMLGIEGTASGVLIEEAE